jgi:transposase
VKTPRFRGLTLTEADQTELEQMQAAGNRLTSRTWRRIRVLELLHEGRSCRQTAEAVGTYVREVSRVGRRYLSGGLVKALSDDHAGGPSRLLDSTQEAAIVAMVCGPPPTGLARWTIRLAASEAQRRGIVDTIGKEKVRLVLATHDLKPWREKNVVRTKDRRGVRRPDGGRARAVRTPVRRG